MAKIEELKFDNTALRVLPVDSRVDEFAISRDVRGACFSRVKPMPLNNPTLVSSSEPALNLIGLSHEETKREDFAEYFCGNKIIPGSEPAAHCYCGYQFGNFAGQLGDGATMYLGEVINAQNERWEIQFKGAGKTPYSRSADGRKVLRSSLREFLCSEANYNLGVPTTRAGTIVTSDSRIARDIFYTGNITMERCSVVLRIAPTFLRFGSFEIFLPMSKMTGRGGPSQGLENEIMPKMLEYTIKTFYPDIWANHPEGHDSSKGKECRAMYLDFYREVVRRTAHLVAEWQCVGFCHGVLNTDNMSILGLTLDYGPFGFLDAYDPDFICNGSDDSGRYAYKEQPDICRWNCFKLAEALSSLLPKAQSLAVLEETYDKEYNQSYNQKMRNKLGLIKKAKSESDTELVKELLNTMYITCSDFTNSFRSLSKLNLTTLKQGENENFTEVLNTLMAQTLSLASRVKACKLSYPPQHLPLLMSLVDTNPEVLASLGADPHSISREVSKLKKMKEWSESTQEQNEKEDRAHWLTWLTKYKDRLLEEVELMSEEEIQLLEAERKRVMDSSNPRVVLRNYIAQVAIEKAEKGDFTEVNKVLNALQHPYAENDDGYDKSPPQWSSELCVTCSS